MGKKKHKRKMPDDSLLSQNPSLIARFPELALMYTWRNNITDEVSGMWGMSEEEKATVARAKMVNDKARETMMEQNLVHGKLTEDGNDQQKMDNEQINSEASSLVNSMGASSRKESIAIFQKGMAIPRTSMAIPRKSMTIPRKSMTIPRKSMTIPRKSMTIPRKSMTFPRKSMTIPRKSMTIPRKSMTIPRESMTNEGRNTLSGLTSHTRSAHERKSIANERTFRAWSDGRSADDISISQAPSFTSDGNSGRRSKAVLYRRNSDGTSLSDARFRKKSRADSLCFGNLSKRRSRRQTIADTTTSESRSRLSSANDKSTSEAWSFNNADRVGSGEESDDEEEPSSSGGDTDPEDGACFAKFRENANRCLTLSRRSKTANSAVQTAEEDGHELIDNAESPVFERGGSPHGAIFMIGKGVTFATLCKDSPPESWRTSSYSPNSRGRIDQDNKIHCESGACERAMIQGVQSQNRGNDSPTLRNSDRASTERYWASPIDYANRFHVKFSESVNRDRSPTRKKLSNNYISDFTSGSAFLQSGLDGQIGKSGRLSSGYVSGKGLSPNCTSRSCDGCVSRGAYSPNYIGVQNWRTNTKADNYISPKFMGDQNGRTSTQDDNHISDSISSPNYMRAHFGRTRRQINDYVTDSVFTQNGISKQNDRMRPQHNDYASGTVFSQNDRQSERRGVQRNGYIAGLDRPSLSWGDVSLPCWAKDPEKAQLINKFAFRNGCVSPAVGNSVSASNFQEIAGQNVGIFSLGIEMQRPDINSVPLFTNNGGLSGCSEGLIERCDVWSSYASSEMPESGCARSLVDKYTGRGREQNSYTANNITFQQESLSEAPRIFNGYQSTRWRNDSASKYRSTLRRERFLAQFPRRTGTVGKKDTSGKQFFESSCEPGLGKAGLFAEACRERQRQSATLSLRANEKLGNCYSRMCNKINAWERSDRSRTRKPANNHVDATKDSSNSNCGTPLNSSSCCPSNNDVKQTHMRTQTTVTTACVLIPVSATW